LTVINNKVLD